MDDVDTLLASRANATSYAYSEGPDTRDADPGIVRIETAGVGTPATDPVEGLLSARASGKALAVPPSPVDKPRTISDFYNFLSSQPFDAADAFGHHLGNFTHGVAQLIENGLASGAEKFAPGTAVAQYFRENADRTNAAMVEREKEYQGHVPDSPGAYAGAALGEIVPFVAGGPGSISTTLKSAGDAIAAIPQAIGSNFGQAGKLIGDAAGRVASGVTQGSLVSTAAPVAGDTTPYWDAKLHQLKTGAGAGGTLSAIGMAGNVAVDAAKGLVNAARPLYNPQAVVSDTILRFLKDPEQAIGNLDSAPSYVSGSHPTTAQVAGDPSLVIAEKTIKNNPAFRAPFEERSASNNAARLSALDDIAKTPLDLDAAKSARERTAGGLYNQANAETVVPDADLNSILSRPSAKAAIDRAKRLAEERGQPFVLDQAGQTSYPVSNLHYVKMALDDMVDGGKMSGIGRHEQSAVLRTQGDLLNWLDRTVPAYKAARASYAAQSAPINTMEAAQDMRESLSSGALNSSGDINPTLASYTAKLAKALKNDYGIEPSAQEALTAIQKDLQRETISNSIKSPGSDTVFNLEAPNWLAKQLYGASLDGKSNFGKAAGGLLGYATGGPAGAAGGFLAGQQLGQIAGNRMRQKLADMLLNPEMAKAGLREAMDRASRQALIAQLLGDPATAALIKSGPQAGAYMASRKAIPAP